MESLPTVSKDILEENLGRKIESFTIYPGSNVGDNYMSVLYAIEVQVRKEKDDTNEIETFHLLSKCYPSHPARQEFLNTSNIFWNELSIYRVFIPEINALAKKIGKVNDLFPALIGGKAIDFGKLRESNDTSYDGKIFEPYDIYIMMTDLRKSRGFRMADRRAGLSCDEMTLAVTAQARLHALSWGYKKIHGLNSLLEKFDFLKLTFTEEDLILWTKLVSENIQMAATALENSLGKDSEIATRTKNLQNYVRKLFDIAFDNFHSTSKFIEVHRIPPKDHVEDEEAWKVLLHGDCWTNNLLFRFDTETSKPVEVVLVDLQMMREHCPTMDLVHLTYCSTTTEFRQKNMTQMLQIYYDEFTSCCDLMQVPSLPGFTLKELTRRFNRSKIYGYFLATMALPIMLKDAKEIVDMETIVGNDVKDVWNTFVVPLSDNSVYSKRIVSMAEELFADGIL